MLQSQVAMRTGIACGVLAGLICGIAIADDTREINTVRSLLRDVSQQVISLPPDMREPSWPLELRDLGLAQIRIGDLEGAIATNHALPTGPASLEFTEEFLTELAAELTLRGCGVETAYVFIQSWNDRPTEYYTVGERLAIACGQAVGNDLGGARTTCLEAIDVALSSEPYYAAFELSEIIRLQRRLRLDEDARKTLPLLEQAASRIVARDEPHGHALSRLADVYLLLGDEDRAKQTTDQVIVLFDRGLKDRSLARRAIAGAYARVGNFSAALLAAREISTKKDMREEALAEIAVEQWKRNVLPAARTTAGMMELHSDGRDLIMLEIAKEHARNRDYREARATAEEIQNDLRRAQAILEISEIQALQGEHVKALSAAQNIDCLRTKSNDDNEPARQFQFSVPTTWGIPFQQSQYIISFAGQRHDQEMEGEFLSAVIRCQIALHGKGSVRYIKEMQEWNVRKAAEAQAAAGDVAGALKWMFRLSDAQRLSAAIGLAEGLATRPDFVRSRPFTVRQRPRDLFTQRFHAAVKDD